MATKHELAQQERDRDTALNEHLEALVDRIGEGPGGVLDALIKAMCWEADSVEEQRRKGWQSEAKSYRAAAGVASTWHGRLLAWSPPTAPPAPTPIGEPTATRDAQGIGIDNRAKVDESLDARLEQAFGPAAAPVRHIRTALAEPTGEDGTSLSSSYGAMCGAAGGSWTSPGGSNCRECHLAYAEQNGGKLYDGPGPVDVKALFPEAVAHYESLAFDVQAPADPTPDPLSATFKGPTVEQVGAVYGRDQEGMSLVEPTSTKVEIDGQNVTADVSAVEITGPPYDHPDGSQSSIPAPTGMDESAQARIAMLDDATVTRLPAAPAIGVPARTVTEITPAVRFYDPGELGYAEPRKLTLTEISARGRALQRGIDHRSYSQVNEFEQCGARYALRNEETIPAWWNVGGTAFHNAAMAVNLAYAATADPALAIGPIGTAWLEAFDTEIARNWTGNSDPSPDTWRVANRGMENQDWWRVEGEHMLTKYVAWLEKMYSDGWRVASDVDGKPLVEAERTFYVQSAPLVKVDNVIDLVLTKRPSDADRTYGVDDVLIVDLKSGAKVPTSNLQLAFYHWALVATTPGGLAGARVRGCYYAARRGETTTPSDVALAFPWPDLATRIVAMDQQERAGLYLPRPNTFCYSCPARRLCPEGPR